MMAYSMDYQRLKISIVLVFSFLLAGCDTTSTQCIAPDDFGFNNFFVGAAGYNVVNPNAMDPICTTPPGPGAVAPRFIDQYSQWQPFPFVANGERVVMMVKNNSASTPDVSTGLPVDATTSWLPWASDTCNQSMCISPAGATSGDVEVPSGNPTSDNSGGSTAASVGANYPTCTYPNDDPSIGVLKQGVPSLNASNSPCWVTQGRGLYCLLTNPNNQNDVNSNQPTIFNPSLVGAVNFHMGNKPFSTDANGNPLGGINEELAQIGQDGLVAQGGGQLYCKILDRYYCDNMGGYSVIIKSGLSSATPSTIAGFISQVQDSLTDASESMFQGLVQDSGFLQYLRALLALYIAIKGIMFMFGMLKGPHQDFYTSLFRISIVLALTNQHAWSFFYNNLFGIYVDGLPELANIFSGAFGSNDTYNSFDTLINTLTSYQTNAKILSMITVSFLGGLVLVLLFYAIFAVVFYLIFKAIMLLIISMVVISLLLTIAPIFFSLILFEATRQFTQSWFKVIAAYTMQGIMIGVMMGFMSTILLSQLQQNLGFPVCWKEWQKTMHFGYFSPTVTPTRGVIDVPGSWYQVPVNKTGFCLPYECSQDRYIDLPFLRPAEGATLYDQAKIDRVLGGNYIVLADLAYMGLFALLLSMINGMIPQLARGLMDMAYSFSGNALQDAMRTFDANNLAIAKSAARNLWKHSKFLREHEKQVRQSLGNMMGRAYQRVTGGRVFTDDMHGAENRLAAGYVGRAYRGMNGAYNGLKNTFSPFTNQVNRYKSGRLDRMAREQITADKFRFIDGLGLEKTRYNKGLEGMLMDGAKKGFWDKALGVGEIERRHAAKQQLDALRAEERRAQRERRQAMWDTGIDPGAAGAGPGIPAPAVGGESSIHAGATVRAGAVPPPVLPAGVAPIATQTIPAVPPDTVATAVEPATSATNPASVTSVNRNEANVLTQQTTPAQPSVSNTGATFEQLSGNAPSTPLPERPSGTVDTVPVDPTTGRNVLTQSPTVSPPPTGPTPTVSPPTGPTPSGAAPNPPGRDAPILPPSRTD